MKPKYVLKSGETLLQYCQTHKVGATYDAIIKRIARYNLTPDEALFDFKPSTAGRKNDSIRKMLKQVAKQGKVSFDDLYNAYLDLKNPKVSIWKRLFQW